VRTLLPLLLALFLSADLTAAGEENRLAEARSLVELGTRYVEIGSDTDEPEKIRKGVAKYREARTLYMDALAEPKLTPAERNRIKAFLLDVESRIDWYASSKVGGAGRVATGEVRIPELKQGERIGPWCRRVRKLYDQTEDQAGQAALARGLASKGGVLALPTLFDLFEKEEYPQAREGVHEALAMVGTYRVARKMAAYARKSAEKHWENALEVIYLCLEKSERAEPEKPYLKSIRRFHRLKNRKLTLQILKRLDSMVPAGTAALGEVVYVEDFGYHDHTIELLSRKRDRRAVPPLVFKMNRFKFEYRVQIPAHKALIKMGWYAVPELVEHLNDKAAGIWISWTLRKISGETMGTDKRKWHDWWKGEKVRHPELFDDPDERPGDAKDPVTTGGGRK